MKITMEECGFESIMIKKNDPLNLVWMGKKGGVKIKKSLISTSLREAQIPPRPLLSVV